jgi:hypothetical protein
MSHFIDTVLNHIIETELDYYCRFGVQYMSERAQ